MKQIQKKVKFLTKEEEYYLFHRFNTQNCIKARNMIIERNVPLAISIAYKVKDNYQHTQYFDICSYAKEGLILAVEKFDYALKLRLSSYASIVILNHINICVEQYESLIRYPQNSRTKLATKSTWTDEQKQQYINHTMKPTRFDHNDKNGTPIEDTFKSESHFRPDKLYQQKAKINAFHKLINEKLNENELKIINTMIQFECRTIEAARILKMHPTTTSKYKNEAFQKLKTTLTKTKFGDNAKNYTIIES